VNNQERDFTVVMTRLCEAFGVSNSMSRMAVYYDALKDMALEDLQAAASEIIRTHEQGGRLPTVAQLRREAAHAYGVRHPTVAPLHQGEAWSVGPKQVSNLLDDLYAKLRTNEVRGVIDTSPPGMLERRGEHEMREPAKVWCRRHPDEAAALPGWRPGLLDRILHPTEDPHAQDQDSASL
jgi:hypothetical protein